MKSCYFSQIHQSSLAYGLKDEPDSLSLQTKDFPCCHGEGLYYDVASDCVVLCGLKKRFAGAQMLKQYFNSIWTPEAFPLSLKPEVQQAWAKWLSTVDLSQLDAGLSVCSNPLATKKPSTLWAVALLGIWQFDLKAHVFALGKSKEDHIIPGSQDTRSRPLIYFVENVHSLWVGENSFVLSQIIDWCERSATPLCLEVVVEKKSIKDDEAEKGIQSTKKLFQSKVKNIKSKPALSWLGPKAQSQVRVVCPGSSHFL